MKRTEAISLFRSSHLTLSEVRTRVPTIATVVDRTATVERIATLDRLRAALPATIESASNDYEKKIIDASIGNIANRPSKPEGVTVLIRRLRESLQSVVGKALDGLKMESVAAGRLGDELGKRVEGLISGTAIPTPETVVVSRVATQIREIVDPLPDEDTSLADIRFLHPGIDLGRFYVLADAVKIAPSQASLLAKTLKSPEAATEEVLTDLVNRQLLNVNEAETLGAARISFLLSDDSEALTRVVAGKQISDLLAMRPSDWEVALKASNAPIPERYDTASWAGELARRHAALAPSQALNGRLLGAFDNPAVPVERIVAAWPGFTLDAVLVDANISPTRHRAALKSRLAPVVKLLDIHPDIDWLSLDYSRDSEDLRALKLDTNFTSDEQEMLLLSLKAQQRVHAITDDVDSSIRLLEGGYHAAPNIALTGLTKLVADTGLALEEVERVHFAATEILGITANTAIGIHSIVNGIFGMRLPDNIGKSAKDYLAQLQGYTELFGSQDWCDCKHCNSILSPAAYFVDMMSFVDEHIREPLFTTERPGHVLDLKVRRPDLWTLPLTCENTDSRIPTLDIINEILENYIAIRTGFVGTLTERTKVHTHVYSEKLYSAAQVRTLKQPFCLPYERVGQLLKQTGRSRTDVAAVVGGNKSVQYLSLSDNERQLTFTAEVNNVQLGRVFDIIIPESGTIAKVSVPDFLRATGLSRDHLGQLVNSWFVRGSENPRIKAEKSSPSSVQNDIERLHGLTKRVLDRMHRFVRLAQAADMEYPELDLWMLERSLSILDENAGEEIARLLAVRDTFSLDLENTLALCGSLPIHSAETDGKSLFDRRFNAPPYLGLGGLLPQKDTPYVHPAFRANDTPADKLTPRLCAGLGVNEEDLSRLILALAIPLEVGDDNVFTLSAGNLSLLYRHAQLTRVLKLPVDQTFQLLVFVENLESPWLSGLDDLELVIEFLAIWREGKRTLDALGVITGGPVLDPAPWPTVDEVVTQIRAEPIDAFRFADTVFSTTLGLTERDSRTIISSNVARFEPIDGGWRLKADFSFSVALEVPTGVSELAVREVLRGYHTSTLLPERLGRALKVDGAKAAGLLGVSGVDREEPGAPLVEAVRGDGASGPLEVLTAVLLRLHALSAPPEIDAMALNFIADQRSMFNLDKLPAIPTLAVWTIDRYARFTRAPSVAFGEAETSLSRADFHSLLLSHDENGFPADKNPTLARALRADRGLASSVRATITVADTAIETLLSLSRAVDLARSLGVSGDTLPLLLSGDYDSLAQAADALVAGFRLRYPDESTANTQLEPVNEVIRARQRDALCSYLLRHLAPAKNIPWRTRADLFHYFLLDVDMGGCGRTSRLVSAISSLQLYVHRVQMSLEQDQRDEEDSQKLRVQLPSNAAEEWVWRKNYRVWEANRKVFLWPENYLEPDLRDDKTDQFVELESTLLQQEINEQTVLDAYTRYLAGFEEVATLRIGGVWYESSASLDRLHVFGATSTEPPIWYYRTVDNLRFSRRNQSDGVRWGNWTKLNVQVPVREVSPVVFEGRLHVFWVELRTRSVNKVASGGSNFVGYDHQMQLKFTTLRPDGTWTAPQDVSLGKWIEGSGVIRDRFRFVEPHKEPHDDYSLSGATWDRVYLDVYDENADQGPQKALGGTNTAATAASGTLANSTASSIFRSGAAVELPKVKLYVGGRNHRLQAVVDLFGRGFMGGTLTDLGKKIGHFSTNWLSNIPTVRGSNRTLYVQTFKSRRGLWNAEAGVLLEEERLKIANAEREGNKLPSDGMSKQAMGTIPRNAILHSVPRLYGSREDLIIQVGVSPVMFHGSAFKGAKARIVRLGTTQASKVSRTLFEGGVESILSLGFQESLKEGKLPITITSDKIELERALKGIERVKAILRGPLGVSYQELFFHIPWRIALHLNAQGRYEAAQRWFHYVFDPTASDTPGADRVWRYAGFRELRIPTLREHLTDKTAIEAYKEDPFNPHAIARLRPSTYQKHMVMRYVDNLLDWADSLFTQFTTESINEALLLYVLASDILGERPARLGDCGEGGPRPRDYEHIKPLLDKGSEFLVELQTWHLSKKKRPYSLKKYGASIATIATAKDSARKKGKRRAPFRGPRPMAIRTAVWKNPSRHDDKGTGARFASKRRVGRPMGPWFGKFGGKFGWTFVRQLSPVFCVPQNKELLAYWDRVEDRLSKIRSCRDINGVPRVPPLFAPEIDPRLLVRARALGLSLDEVLGGTGGSLPPYRFLYLIEKAKTMAATVTSFGAALLLALEKKDVEQLNRLRIIQQQNIVKLTTSLRRWEVDLAEEALAVLDRQIEAVRYRKEYYANLDDTGRTGWEVTQSVAVHTSTISHGVAALLEGTVGILALIPQLGSPFAMKYGGVELKGSAKGWAAVARDTASLANLIASSAGLEGYFERRAEVWTHQRKLAEHDLKQLKHQRKIAVLRIDIATRALEIHEESAAQIEEMFAFYDGKFTGLGLYTWLATTLQRVYRGTYNNALALARLADEAFRYERGTSDFMIDASYWDASHAGLGAGEQLLLALQSLERRFIETNHRNHEIDQAFSLQQVAPAAVIQLRMNGACDFDIPELFFDLAYPGHYRRRIKTVRLTIPCITGPFVNISAMLSLTQSRIRSEASGELLEFPVRRSVSVATSTAQNDAGVFELSFRDERYMPFEGAGAVSRWRLELPNSFRAFDYGTINDVILSISYTAEYDGALRDQVQQSNEDLERSLLSVLQNHPVPRVFSLKHDYATSFNRLLHGAAGSEVPFEVSDAQLSFFLAGRTLLVEKAILGVELREGADANGLALAVDGVPLALASQPDLAGMLGAELPPEFRNNFRSEHSITVLDGGGLQPSDPLPGDPSPLDDGLVRDFVFYVELKVAP